MLLKRVMMIVPALALCLTGPVRGQAEIDVLIFWTGNTLHGWDAAGRLGYTRLKVATESDFLKFMTQSQWDLVILEMPQDKFTQKEVAAGLLEDHVAAGGRLLVNFNNLDEWPRLQKLLGVARAEDPPTWENVEKTDPIHPSFPRNHYRSGNVTQGGVWPDSGDWLWPSVEGAIAGIFAGGEPAIVVSNEDRTLVNGFDWDSYLATASFVEEQIKYIMSCKPDLDESTGPGKLDIFDFLEFQDLFVKQDPLANMAFDGNFDIFDFLVFQNRFVSGCK